MRRISSWNSSKFVTCSSFLFTIPGIYTFINHSFVFPPLLLFTTSIISANYWRNAIDDWRRKLDLYFSKISFTYFIGCCVYYVPWKINMLVSYPNLACILYCFHKSGTEYEKEKKCWLYYHIGFHSLITVQLFLIFNYMGKYKINLPKNILMPNKI